MLVYPISHHLTVFQRLFHTRSWLHFFIEGFILQSERLQNVWNVWAMRAFNDVKMDLIRAWYWNMELCSNLGTSTVVPCVFEFFWRISGCIGCVERHSDLLVLHAMLHHISLHRAFARRNSAFKALRLACTLQLWNRHRICEKMPLPWHVFFAFFSTNLWFFQVTPILRNPHLDHCLLHLRSFLHQPQEPSWVFYKKFQLLEDAPLLDQWHHIRPLVAQRVNLAAGSCTGRNLVKALRVKHKILDWNTE